MRLEPLGDDGVLDGDVGGGPRDGEGLVAAPGRGHVVEDHAVAVGDGDGVLARGAAAAHAHADVPDDGVVGVGPGPAVAVDGDTLKLELVYRKSPSLLKGLVYISWGSLSGNVDAGRDHDAGLDVDHAADFEDDDTV